MTGKTLTHPGLTIKNEASESMTDSKAAQETIETLTKTISEFREANMIMKLKECQVQRLLAYRHLVEYFEGDKVWYQQQNGNA